MAAHRTLMAAVVVVVMVVVPVVVPVVGGRVEAADCWRPPVDAAVSDPFRDPGCPWCAGNRGLEYATAPGQAVTAVAPGRVTFVGPVAGTSYVVVDVGRGRRVTYGRLLEVRPSVGDVVVRGAVLGRADAAFHLGVRLGDRYVDPAPLLGRLVGRARLVPTDGSEAPPAPPPVLRCPADRPAWHGALGPGAGRMFHRSTVR